MSGGARRAPKLGERGVDEPHRRRVKRSAVRTSEKAQTLLSTRWAALAAAMTSVSLTFRCLPLSETTQRAPRSARLAAISPIAAKSAALSAP